MTKSRKSLLMVGLMIAVAFLPLLPMTATAADISWTTDTVIPDNQNYNGDKITLTGNLTITGNLTFTNVDFLMNPAENGSLVITVEDGASFKVLGKSKIHSTDKDLHFKFRVRYNATLIMNDSELHDCGVDYIDWDNWTSNPNDERGLYIDSSTTVISNSTITENAVGILVDNSSSPLIFKNNISANDAAGIEVFGSSSPVIDHNLVSGNLLNTSGWNFEGGILSTSSSPIISNNTIRANIDIIGGWSTYGVALTAGGTPSVIFNNISNHNDPWGQGSGVGLYVDGTNTNIYKNNFTANDAGCVVISASCTIEKNLFELNVDQQSGIGLGEMGSSTAANNTYSKNNGGIFLGEASTASFKNETIIGNTICGVTGNADRSAFTNTMTNCTFNQNARDILFNQQGQGGGTLTLITPSYHPNLVTVTNPATTLTVKWNLRARVLYENGLLPINGAAVNFTDTKGTDAATSTTDSDGWTETFLLEEYSRVGATLKSKAPYTVTAKKDARTNSTPNVMLNESMNATVIIDNIDPWVSIASPLNNTLTNKSVIKVCGTAEPGVTLQLNGDPVTVNAGTWSANAALIYEGSNEIYVQVWDKTLNRDSESIFVWRDTISPALNLTSPKEGLLTNKTSIPVIGTTTDPAATTTVNGLPVTVDGEGKFSTTVTLEEGFNTIEVVSRDAANNTARMTRIVERDTLPPELRITEPKNGYTTTASTITVRGTVEAGAIATVNNRTLSVAGSDFSATLDIYEGDNYFYFSAKDKAGNVNTTLLWVVKDSLAPSLAISSPVDKAKLNRSLVDVKGKTEAGAHVKVNGEDVELYGTDFCTTLQLKEGDNTITVEASDKLGNHVETVLKVFVDTIAPELKITGPINNTLTNKQSIEVRGRTDPGANVKVGGMKVPVDAAGLWSAQVNLDEEGKNVITATAWDSVFNTVEARVTIIRDTKVDFNITSPAEGAKLKTRNCTVAGDAEKGVVIKVGAATVSQRADGTFSADVLLVDGPNTINITITDIAGNEVVYSVNVTKAKSAPKPVGKGFIPGFEGIALGVALTATVALVGLRRRDNRKRQH